VNATQQCHRKQSIALQLTTVDKGNAASGVEAQEQMAERDSKKWNKKN